MKLHKLAALMALTAAFGSAQAAISNGTFNVTVKVTPTCRAVATNTGQAAVISNDTPTLAGADINFGTQVADDANTAINVGNTGGATNTITVRCSKKTPYTVGLTPGNNASTSGSGIMKGGIVALGNTDTVPYQLYKPTIAAGVPGAPASTNQWGNVTSGAGANVVALQGNGLAAVNAVRIPVYATLPANSLDVTPDRYQDQVTVTLTW